MQTYQSKFTGAQIDAAIEKVSKLETSISANSNSIKDLKAKDVTLQGNIDSVNERIDDLHSETDHYDFPSSQYNSLTSNVGMTVPIPSADIEKYKYFTVSRTNPNNGNTDTLLFYYAGRGMATDGTFVHMYGCYLGGAFLWVAPQSSTTITVRLYGEISLPN